MNMMKLSVKILIQSALSLGRTLDSDFPPLQQFFVVLEHCLKHGLKGGRPLPAAGPAATPRAGGEMGPCRVSLRLHCGFCVMLMAYTVRC